MTGVNGFYMLAKFSKPAEENKNPLKKRTGRGAAFLSAGC
jgi:hypothetical protein